MKLCMDCRHSGAESIPLCHNSTAAHVSPVDGKPLQLWAVFNRALGRPCGPDAKLFEPKTTERAA